jgi:hypothetical protein
MGAQISHTSSSEWQSFEARMRRRRAERCILRAEVAAQEGRLDEARAALDEARKLSPALAEIGTVEASIFGRDATNVAESGSERTRRLLYYAAAVLAGVAILSMGFVWWQRSNGHWPTLPPATVRQQAPVPVAGRTPAALPRPSTDVRVETVAVTATSITEAPAVSRPASTVLEARANVPPAVSAVAEPPMPPPDPEPIHHEPISGVIGSPVPAVLREVPAVRDLALASTSTASAPMVPLPAPPVRRIDENTAVRTVLHRYADAYSRLDASAAQEVWPGVNRAALSRAFDSLASQDITLGTCAVDVSGASARATCAGAATWAPKVGGGGARTEQRNWTFQLAKAGQDWQIVNARVQNR